MIDRQFADKLEDGYNLGLLEEDQIHPEYAIETPHFSDVDGEWLLAEVHEFFMDNNVMGRQQWHRIIREVHSRQ